MTALEWGEESALHPGRTLPPGKDPVPIVQEAGWQPHIQEIYLNFIEAIPLCVNTIIIYSYVIHNN